MNKRIWLHIKEESEKLAVVFDCSSLLRVIITSAQHFLTMITQYLSLIMEIGTNISILSRELLKRIWQLNIVETGKKQMYEFGFLQRTNKDVKISLSHYLIHQSGIIECLLINCILLALLANILIW